jgi:hypothetical protein
VVPRERPKARGLRARIARLRIPIIVALIGAVAVGLWALQSSHTSSTSSPRAEGVVRPPAGTEEAAHRLRPAVKPPPGPGQYEFQQHQPGDSATPVAFDPCRPIHWVYNPAGEPSDGMKTVRDGFATLARATGLRFVYDGTTTEAPKRDRAAYQPTTYDRSRWAPVLVAWSDEHSFPPLAGYVTGVTRPDGIIRPDGRSVYVSGVVVLDAVDLADAAMPLRPVVRATVLHELGHLVGLDHTSDRTQLMFSETQPGVLDYGAGDRHGLALEGSQACFPDV